MKKIFLFLMIFNNFIFSLDISCIGDIRSDKIVNLSITGGIYEYYDYGDGGFYTNLDFVSESFYYFDNDSAVCGGNLDENIFIKANCKTSLDGSCWDSFPGIKENQMINYDQNGFFNNVIMVSTYPCLPSKVTSVTGGLHSSQAPYNNADNSYVWGKLNTFEVDRIEYLSSEKASEYRSICKKDEQIPDNQNDDKIDKILSFVSSNSNKLDLNNDKLTNIQSSINNNNLKLDENNRKIEDSISLLSQNSNNINDLISKLDNNNSYNNYDDLINSLSNNKNLQNNTNKLTENSNKLTENSKNIKEFTNILKVDEKDISFSPFDDIQNFSNNLKTDLISLKTDFNDIKSTVEKGFNFELKSSSYSGSCFSINIFDKSISFDICNSLVSFKPIFSFLIKLFIIYHSILIIIKALTIFRLR